MKKQDLKAGMVVEIREGEKYLITKGHDHLVLTCLPSGSVYDVLEHYNDDLKMSSAIACLLGVQKESDIVKVYSDHTMTNILWERKVKPSLNIDEINLLRFIQRYHDRKRDYEWIARDEDGGLYVYVSRPEKRDDYWDNKHHLGDLGPIGGANPLRPFNDMFKFIKWEDEEPYSISELLKGANY